MSLKGWRGERIGMQKGQGFLRWRSSAGPEFCWGASPHRFFTRCPKPERRHSRGPASVNCDGHLPRDFPLGPRSRQIKRSVTHLRSIGEGVCSGRVDLGKESPMV